MGGWVGGWINLLRTCSKQVAKAREYSSVEGLGRPPCIFFSASASLKSNKAKTRWGGWVGESKSVRWVIGFDWVWVGGWVGGWVDFTLINFPRPSTSGHGCSIGRF